MEQLVLPNVKGIVMCQEIRVLGLVMLSAKRWEWIPSHASAQQYTARAPPVITPATICAMQTLHLQHSAAHRNTQASDLILKAACIRSPWVNEAVKVLCTCRTAVVHISRQYRQARSGKLDVHAVTVLRLSWSIPVAVSDVLLSF